MVPRQKQLRRSEQIWVQRPPEGTIHLKMPCKDHHICILPWNHGICVGKAIWDHQVQPFPTTDKPSATLWTQVPHPHGSPLSHMVQTPWDSLHEASVMPSSLPSHSPLQMLFLVFKRHVFLSSTSVCTIFSSRENSAPYPRSFLESSCKWQHSV